MVVLPLDSSIGSYDEEGTYEQASGAFPEQQVTNAIV